MERPAGSGVNGATAAADGAASLRLADGESARQIARTALSTPLPPRPDVFDGSVSFNRDLSLLEFNRRVLSLAQDDRTPLLERVRFLSIFSSNLDEFVMKRLGLLSRRIKQGVVAVDQDGVPTAALMAALRRTIRDLQAVQMQCYEEDIRPALVREGITIVDYETLPAEERRALRQWYRHNVFPVLTPLAVDTGHRFPFVSNLSRNLGVLMTEPGMPAEAEPLFARVKIPSVLPQWLRLPDQPGQMLSLTPAPGAGGGRGRWVSLRDIIQNNLDDLFPGMRLLEVVPFRVTRDSESEIDEEDADTLIEQVEAQLKKRRFAAPVRVEIGPGASPRMVAQLADELHLDPSDFDERAGLLDYTTLTEIADLERPELKWPRWMPVTPGRLAEAGKDIFSVIRQGEVLVHHPFDSFTASAERFIAEASRDPDVLAIKQTIYRTSRDSPFVSSLVRAAEAGKQVAVLIELRARFDEQSNVRLARILEKAGAHVAYGVIGYKTHCKAALVVRREADGLRSYAHVGTGNYHPRTAMLYTDLGLFSCDPAITEDVAELFNFMTGRSRLDTYETLLVAPINMKKRFIDLVRREADLARAHATGRSPVGGRIVVKMNAFADTDMAEALYEASRAGVDITMYVRGFCCLRPGVPGMSENIRVVSVLGRFLEHSRVFHFGAGHADPLDGEWYIASADWMYRNLNNRVESACPVLTRTNRARLARILEVMSRDRRGAWDLMPDGSYLARTPQPGTPADAPEAVGTFETLMREARA
ncbi:MAG: polyphosphate kinase 1 [Phycisphaeraceae bacterium]|nr:polyphosphate kinase 1 [Phycisphaeraceae bacterium]